MLATHHKMQSNSRKQHQMFNKLQHFFFHLESKVNVSLVSNETGCQYTFDENFNGLKRGLNE